MTNYLVPTSSSRQKRFHLKSTILPALYLEILWSDGGRCDRHREWARGRRSDMATSNIPLTLGFSTISRCVKLIYFFGIQWPRSQLGSPWPRTLLKMYILYFKRKDSIWHLRHTQSVGNLFDHSWTVREHIEALGGWCFQYRQVSPKCAFGRGAYLVWSLLG